jgi:hypothetical protein
VKEMAIAALKLDLVWEATKSFYFITDAANKKLE